MLDSAFMRTCDLSAVCQQRDESVSCVYPDESHYHGNQVEFHCGSNDLKSESFDLTLDTSLKRKRAIWGICSVLGVSTVKILRKAPCVCTCVYACVCFLMKVCASKHK